MPCAKIKATSLIITTARKMQLKKKKIQLIYCGGLNLKKKDQNDNGLNKWLKTMPELVLMAEIKPKFLVSKNESINEYENWQKLNRYIFKNRKKFDGFIVICDIDSLQNYSIATSFMLAEINKPVVFTTEPNLLEESKKKLALDNVLDDYGVLSIKANLINALQFVNYGLPEVALMFGSKLIKAVRSQVNKDSLNIFDSYDQPLGTVAFSMSIGKKISSKKEKKAELQDAFDSSVVYLKVYSGFSAQLIEDLSQTKNGIILDFEKQNTIIEGLEKISTNNKAVVFYNLEAPMPGHSFIEIKNILPHVLIIKLMWALGRTKDLRQLKKILHTDVCGEFLHSPQPKKLRG